MSATNTANSHIKSYINIAREDSVISLSISYTDLYFVVVQTAVPRSK